MQKCSSLGYNIHVIGELIGFLGLLTLLGTIGYMIYLAIIGNFIISSWLLLLIPFCMGITSEVLVQISWYMVTKRGFQYDYEKREASWMENGKRISYQYAQQDDSPDTSGADHL